MQNSTHRSNTQDVEHVMSEYGTCVLGTTIYFGLAKLACLIVDDDIVQESY